jgi:hypothetical protein
MIQCKWKTYKPYIRLSIRREANYVLKRDICILGKYNCLRNIPAFRKVFPRELWFLCEGIFDLRYYEHNKHKQFLKFTTIGISIICMQFL